MWRSSSGRLFSHWLTDKKRKTVTNVRILSSIRQFSIMIWLQSISRVRDSGHRVTNSFEGGLLNCSQWRGPHPRDLLGFHYSGLHSGISPFYPDATGDLLSLVSDKLAALLLEYWSTTSGPQSPRWKLDEMVICQMGPSLLTLCGNMPHPGPLIESLFLCLHVQVIRRCTYCASCDGSLMLFAFSSLLTVP